MKELFFMGGPLFMAILSLIFIAGVSWIAYFLIAALFSKNTSPEVLLRKIAYGKSIGLFAMIFGILGQLLGLYQAFSVIEQSSNLAPYLIYNGLKVSMIPTLYGVIIYLITLLFWFVSSSILENRLK